MKANAAGLGGAPLGSPAHIHLGYDGLIQEGMSGLRKEIEGKKAALDMGDPGFMDKSLFYLSCLICCDAFSIFAERHAAHAETLASAEKDEAIRAGYRKVAEVCRHVASKPAETLHQALQAIWFAQVLAIIETGICAAFGFGRMDQYLAPYYEQDVQTGVITPEGAQELLDCLWIKTAEPLYAFPAAYIKFVGGMPLGQQLDIGGVDADGRDASSEISYMMLQATMNTRLNQPTVGVLWHRGMPEALAEKAVELTSLGTGHPSHYSSDAMVRMLQTHGLTEEEARQGCLIGCLEPQGKQGTTEANVTGGWFTPAMALELVFNNGVSRLTQEQVGPRSGDPRTFDSFEDLLEAFKSQVYSISKSVALQARYARQVHHQFPLPFQSLLTPHCIETGVDVIDGGAEFNFPPAATLTGIADYIDTMAAIKYLIFDEKKISWDQLLRALDTNFEDMETTPSGPEIRQMCLTAPKYGNDDDYVDGLAGELMNLIPDVMDQVSADTGNPIRPGVTPMTGYMAQGLAIGALPSGRKAFEPLADGVSPKQGMDRNGPTGVVRSVTSWRHDRWSNGTQFNMKFSPVTLKDRAGVKKFADLIRVFQESGGMHVQCNVISADTLKDAQKHPENYPGLMVRVAGYSAQFADLDVTVQDDIISRTEHSL
jgi:formate C-acetyltransferase